MTYKYNLIAAMSSNFVIGKDNDLPWNLPTDLKRFKKLTHNHTIVMGRKTFESIGSALPNRRNIIISSQDLKIDGVEVFSNIEETKKLPGKIFYIGGVNIFSESFPFIEKLYLTFVHKYVDNGDTYFPWAILDLTDFDKDLNLDGSDGGVRFTFVDYVKKGL